MDLLLTPAFIPTLIVVAVATSIIRKKLSDKVLPVAKVRQTSHRSALFVRSDGRTYRKYYEDAGRGIGRSKVSVLPWGKLFYRDTVIQLANPNYPSYR